MLVIPCVQSRHSFMAALQQKLTSSLNASRYLPSRYWAVAIPSMVFVTTIVAVVTYIAVNFMSTAPLDSFDTITGETLSHQALPRWLRQTARGEVSEFS